MITKSGIDTKNFEFETAGLVSEDLYLTYTSKIPTGLYVLENKNGMEVCITNVGGRIVSIMVPDKNGNLQDVVLGFDNLKSYVDYDQKHSNFQGAIVGRYANRIANAKFELDGKTYKLPVNNCPNCLHGGPYGFSYQTFSVLIYDKENAKLVLKLISPDGDMGFPGKLELIVTYKLEDDNSLHISYLASSDAPTVVNFTNHAYFNLSGNHEKTVLDDKLFICAKQITPLDDKSCPDGTIRNIPKGNPFDFYNRGLLKPKYFKQGKRVGKDINSADEQIKLGNGYDHNYVLLDKKKCTLFGPKPYKRKVPYCAKVYNEDSGITLEIFTTEPGVQLYDSVDLDGSLIGKKGIPLKKNCGLCLETQHFANSPNVESYPNTVLRPSEQFKSKSIYKFS